MEEERAVTWEAKFGDVHPDMIWARLIDSARQHGVIFRRDTKPVLPTQHMARAFMNSWRWLVLCPDETCGGVEYAREDGLFMCQGCWNAAFKRQFLKVPFSTQRKEVEALLVKRPDIRTRNWRPGETLEALKKENAEHGVE